MGGNLILPINTLSGRICRSSTQMPVIIDGHNLIPRIPGLSLRDIDDELRLVQLLQDFCQRSRKQVEVFFDNAPPGSAGVRSFGSVKARFIGKANSRPGDPGWTRRFGTQLNCRQLRPPGAGGARRPGRVLKAEEFARRS
jgi:hypothetical protein